jgi:hypothetical protein
MKKVLTIFLILSGFCASAQVPALNDIVRSNTLTPAKVANALDGSKSFTASGTNTYTVSTGFNPYVGSATYAAGDMFTIVFTNANTSTTNTVNIDTEGAVALKDDAGNDLSVGALKAGGAYKFRHNGTNFRMVGSSGGSGATPDLQAVLDEGATATVANVSIEATNGLSIGGSTAKLVTDAFGNMDLQYSTLSLNGDPGSSNQVLQYPGVYSAITATEVVNTPAGGIAATNVQTAVNELDTEKAPLASPALTGSPTAPTQTPSTNNTTIATTAYADAAVTAAALPAADATHDGYLTQTDWSLFNAGRYLTATGGTATGANTFTGSSTNTFKYVFPSLGTTVTDGAGAWYQNTTAAAAGAQQISPGLVFEGRGWKTNATAASQAVKWRQDVLPVQGAVSPTANLRFTSEVNGSATNGSLTLLSDGARLATQANGLQVLTNSGTFGGITLTAQAAAANSFGFANTGFVMSNAATVTSAVDGMQFYPGTFTATSGAPSGFRFMANFNPTSGTATFDYFSMSSAQGISQTGGANGATALFNLKPTLSTGGDFRFFNFEPTITGIAGAAYGLTVASNTFRNGYGTTTPNSTLQVSGSLSLAYTAQTGTYPITATDYLINCTANSFTVTLPTAVGITGRVYIIKNTGAGTITIATTSSQTIDGSAPGSLAAGPTIIRVMSDGANWITL